MDKSIHLDKLSLGVCYYPEHWDEALWQDDLRRMKALGVGTVRVFEFAWSVVEPREGEYDFALFDRFLNLAAAEGVNVILCTPTATPPAWLTSAHPEVLNRTKDGLMMHHGHRRHYNYNSPVYQQYVRGIVTTLAKRYGRHPAVVGWQLDNELNCEVDEFYSEADHAAFREWLRARFGTLDKLNDAIGARFWSQSYSGWDEVALERHTPPGQGNPHMALLGKAFFSFSAIRFAKLQSDILRQYIGDRFITTNGIFGHLDNEALTQEALDFITFDSYPNFAYGQAGVNGGAESSLRDRESSMRLSRVHALSPNFGVMEQQSGANGWDFSMLAPMPLPGQMRLWTMQSVGHGADYISYFRWRTAPYGTEIYWHGLNDYDNRPNRRLDELATIRDDFAALKDVAGSRYEARVAMLYDWLNEWDGERDLWHGPMDRASRLAIFAAAQRAHAPMDTVNLRAGMTADELSRYDVIFYPHATILTDETAALLRDYCERGGKLIVGARTGYKDEYGRCPMRPMPGPARELCGAEVVEYTLPHPSEQTSLCLDGVEYEAPMFWEALRPVEGGEQAATFHGGHLDGECAMTVKRHGERGAAYYVGSGFCEALADALLEALGQKEPYAKLARCEPSVELCVRRKGDARYLFLLNYTGCESEVEWGEGVIDAITGTALRESTMLPPYGVMVARA